MSRQAATGGTLAKAVTTTCPACCESASLRVGGPSTIERVSKYARGPLCDECRELWDAGDAKSHAQQRREHERDARRPKCPWWPRECRRCRGVDAVHQIERMDRRMGTKRRCFACDRPLSPNPYPVSCVDDQWVYVGVNCWRMVRAAGSDGYQPPKGGPRLFPLRPEHLERIKTGPIPTTRKERDR